MRSITITLKDEKPLSMNIIWAGMHHSQRTAIKNAHHWAIRAALPAEPVRFHHGRVDVVVTAYQAGRLIDADNITVKGYIDALVECGVLRGDSPTWVRSVTKISEKDKASPRIEIQIREAE